MSELNPFSLRQIRAWLQEYHVRPSKGWGQNFLTDRRVASRVLDAAALQPEDAVLEIGPGLGALTLLMAQKVRHIIAVEVDARLVAILQMVIDAQRVDNITLIQANALSQPVPDLLRGETQAKVVANIPYSITSPLLEHLLKYKSSIPLIVLTIQKEVAERLVAAPGDTAYGALSLFVQYHTHAEYLGRVPNTAFYPQPEVDSAIVRLTPLPDRLPPYEQSWFFKLTRAGFGKRRKTLRNALTALFDDADRASAILRRTGIQPSARAEELSLEQWLQLARETARTVNRER
ncbi:MAG: 16S rRNA (adenine(1518)-N(6)/adenine(1519)-N(6))-dimethyltransferase [Armatimonadetes bacterium JP3_11]|jgi:16S rRNA (adenine1518-N6/adenine1519-N6)-dimethyltransferase|nr:MAG: 16S rRNA (adenine(1518)-N(6)/adenine(1519)-N(6))-dimethyltransferase [Armatimonadetes bacterium CP1_7O]OYT75374.1 MAG: 16S rRNA (adenine(1518)-N(6)/adenine(1519)-N(6))-dimethyltransferase [Armatimonadetes bacterium JP3_11]RMH06992.1 MAG: ribosomal RNA small subunit methyltransferase A [Armatimonadota bacterium]